MGENNKKGIRGIPAGNIRCLIVALFLAFTVAGCAHQARAASVTVTVTDSSYSAITGMTVKISSNGQSWVRRTGSGGTFSISGVPSREPFEMVFDRGDGTEPLHVGGLVFPAESADLPVSVEYGIIYKGDWYSVSLPSNPSTGYSWNILSGDGPPLKYQDSSFSTEATRPGSQLRCGTGGTEKFVFRAVGLGRSKIVLGYTRTWDKGADPVLYHICTVMSRIKHR